jgi:hypothetical protein
MPSSQAFNTTCNHVYANLTITCVDLFVGVHSIFAKLGANDSALAETLTAAGVTDSNVMTHLGLIEQRVSQAAIHPMCILIRSLLILAQVSELMQMYEMSVQGIPLTLPTEEEEVSGCILNLF